LNNNTRHLVVFFTRPPRPEMSAASASRAGAVASRPSGRRGARRAARASSVARAGSAEAATGLGCEYTYLGGNSFFCEFRASRVKVLCDPWLVGDLTFWDLPELYKGTKASLSGNESEWMERAKTADVILLSQGWEDHAHRPTLRLLPKHIPVVGSPAAAEVAKALGFTRVTGLRANASVEVSTLRAEREKDAEKEKLLVVVAEGASVGPPWSPREAGFFLADGADGARMYYEPHCSYAAESVRRGLAQVGGRVDVCVTPVRSVDVAGFTLVAGGGAAADLIDALGTPKLVIPLRNGELTQTGASVGLLGTDGTTGETFARLCDARFGRGAVTVQMPVPGVPVDVRR
jgi:hypothetical protein